MSTLKDKFYNFLNNTDPVWVQTESRMKRFTLTLKKSCFDFWSNFPKNRRTEGNLKPSYGLNLIDLHWQNTWTVWEPRLRIVPEDPIKNRGRRKATLPGGSWGPSSGARPRIKARWAAVGRVNHKAWLDTARRSYVAEKWPHSFFRLCPPRHTQKKTLGSGALPESWQWRQRAAEFYDYFIDIFTKSIQTLKGHHLYTVIVNC